MSDVIIGRPNPFENTKGVIAKRRAMVGRIRQFETIDMEEDMAKATEQTSKWQSFGGEGLAGTNPSGNEVINPTLKPVASVINLSVNESVEHILELSSQNALSTKLMLEKVAKMAIGQYIENLTTYLEGEK